MPWFESSDFFFSCCAGGYGERDLCKGEGSDPWPVWSHHLGTSQGEVMSGQADRRVETVADQPLLSDSLTAIELWHSYQIVCDKAGQGELIYKPGQAIDLFIGVYVFYCECIIIFSSSIMHFTCVTLFMCD